jgi:hypothetical protein
MVLDRIATGPPTGETGVVSNGTPVSSNLGLKEGYYYVLESVRATLLDQTVERALGLVYGAASITARADAFTAAAQEKQIDLVGGTLGSKLPLVLSQPLPLRNDVDAVVTYVVRHADNIANGPLSVYFALRISERREDEEW